MARRRPNTCASSPTGRNSAWSGYIGTITDITDRKAVETSLARAVEATTGELRGKTEELDAVLDSVPAAIWISKDPEGKVIVGNRRSYELVGMSPGENVSKSSPDGEAATPYDVYIDGRRARPEELPIQRSAATGQPIYGQEQEIRGPGNRSRWIYGNAIPLLDERGKVKQVIAAFIDVTERKRAERDRALLAALVESSEDAIMAIDLAGAITSWNRGAVGLYGYSESEALGQPNSIIIPEDLRADQKSVLERVRRGERIEHYETRRRTRDGRILDVSLVVSPIRDEAGEIVGFSKIARDISERKRAQERTRFLAHASEMLSASLDYERTISKVADFAARSPLSDWCAVVLREGDVVRQAAVAHRDPAKLRWAREFERRYPFDPGRDRIVMDVIETGRPVLLAEIPDALLRAGARDEEHYRALRDAGMRSAMVVPLAAAGRVLGALTLVSAESRRPYTEEDLELAESLAERAAIAFENARLYRAAQEDIARRKAVEEQIRAVNATLEVRIQERTAKLTEALHELEAFSYTVAHDLRAPLRAMAGLSRILMEDHIQEADKTGHEYARRIVESGKRMDTMVQDLLEYSRLVREELRLEPIDLGELLKEVLSSMEADLAERGAAVAVRDPFPAVLAHRGALTQAVTNLIQNAAKFVLPGKRPEIIISAETKPGVVVLSVEDRGIGIAPEHHERIFGVFQRLHDDRAYPGTGIGLAIVRKAMERMGGRAGVESRPGHGSRFWLELKQGGKG
jgi:PAS domain S-box-containing protein